MTVARERRRCALQALYQFDAGAFETPDLVRASLGQAATTDRCRDEGFELALAAWHLHAEADATVSELAPDWPTHRQPVVDRSILRLAYYELCAESAPPKVVINEAVELAREFSTEKSPLFVNGVLDRIYRARRGDGDTDAGAADGDDALDTAVHGAAEAAARPESDTPEPCAETPEPDA